MVKAVKERFSTIDVLINNAGITKDGLMMRMSEEQYDIVIAVNQKIKNWAEVRLKSSNVILCKSGLWFIGWFVGLNRISAGFSV